MTAPERAHASQGQRSAPEDPKAAIRAAETLKKRRQRAKAKAAGDPIKHFLLAVVADSKQAVADPKVKAEPWQLAVADQALVLLERLDTASADVRSVRPDLLNIICLAHGAEDEEDREDLLAYHDEQYVKWAEDPTNVEPATARKVVSAKSEQAQVGLGWAEAERAAGRANSPIIRQGLRSAGLLIRHRTAPDAVSAYMRYTQHIAYMSLQSALNDFDPPYGFNPYSEDF
jgi:hypothetical protein